METNVREDYADGLILRVEMWCDGDIIVKDESGCSLDKEDLFDIIKTLNQQNNKLIEENSNLKEDLLSIRYSFGITPDDVWL